MRGRTLPEATPPLKGAAGLLHCCFCQEFSMSLDLPCALSLPVLALTYSWPVMIFIIIIWFCFQKGMRTFPLLKKLWKSSSMLVLDWPQLSLQAGDGDRGRQTLLDFCSWVVPACPCTQRHGRAGGVMVVSELAP